jgi:hypothetical protein
MKIREAILICGLLSFLLSVSPSASAAALALVTNAEPQHIFFGDSRKISLTLRNPADQDFDDNISATLFQTSSATAISLGDKPWKKLRVLAGQTVFESAALDFPAVKAQTMFLVQWVEDNKRVIGTTEIFVYPTNLLDQLKRLAKGEELGLFDPLNQSKPLLPRDEFVNLEEAGIETFHGKLAIFGPFESQEQMRAGLLDEIQTLAQRNVAIVWLQPPAKKSSHPQPSFYSVPKKKVAIVIVQSKLVADLPQNPESQQNLIYFCQIALAPEPMPVALSNLK